MSTFSRVVYILILVRAAIMIADYGETLTAIGVGLVALGLLVDGIFEWADKKLERRER